MENFLKSRLEPNNEVLQWLLEQNIYKVCFFSFWLVCVGYTERNKLFCCMAVYRATSVFAEFNKLFFYCCWRCWESYRHCKSNYKSNIEMKSWANKAFYSSHCFRSFRAFLLQIHILFCLGSARAKTRGILIKHLWGHFHRDYSGSNVHIRIKNCICCLWRFRILQAYY